MRNIELLIFFRFFLVCDLQTIELNSPFINIYIKNISIYRHIYKKKFMCFLRISLALFKYSLIIFLQLFNDLISFIIRNITPD